VTVDVEGLDGGQRDSVIAAISLSQYAKRDVSSAQIETLYAQAEEEISAGLRPFGYYNPTIKGKLEHEGNAFHALFQVERGPATHVAGVTVDVQGDAADDATIKAALKAFRPTVGDQLDDAQYEESKQRITTALRGKGYFDAKLSEHQVRVTKTSSTATIELVWQSGPRYRFGDVRFSDAQFSERFMQRHVTWKSGAYYSESALLELQQRLVDADYFAVVSVRPDTEHAQQGVMPIQVLLVQAKRNVYLANVYVSTDTGPGVRLGFERRWLNSRGHKLNTTIDYSQRRQEAAATYTIPLPGPDNRSYSFGAAYRKETTDTSESRTTRLAATQSQRWHGFTRTVGLKFITGDFDIGHERGSSKILYAEGVLSRRRVDDLFFTKNGSGLTLTLRLAPEENISDTRMLQGIADYKWIHSMSSRDRVILRGAAGAMTVDDFNALPPELRFFAGGDRSVRGFAYEAIGEQNAAGDVIGGKYLVVTSAEYERYFLPNWGIATFIDAGDAFSSSFNANVGAGLGLRWKSPVGLVRLDVAQVLKSEFGRTWRAHIVIGPDL
jgi:translocation and assembly module TamA